MKLMKELLEKEFTISLYKFRENNEPKLLEIKYLNIKQLFDFIISNDIITIEIIFKSEKGII